MKATRVRKADARQALRLQYSALRTSSTIAVQKNGASTRDIFGTPRVYLFAPHARGDIMFTSTNFVWRIQLYWLCQSIHFGRTSRSALCTCLAYTAVLALSEYTLRKDMFVLSSLFAECSESNQNSPRRPLTAYEWLNSHMTTDVADASSLTEPSVRMHTTYACATDCVADGN